MSIDKRRPLHIRTAANGMRVFQYKDQPGSYYDANGNAVSELVAQQAGYDIVEGRVRLRERELRDEALREAEKRLREQEHEIRAKARSEVAQALKDVGTRTREQVVTKESLERDDAIMAAADAYPQMVDDGSYIVVSGSNQRLAEGFETKDDALRFIEDLQTTLAADPEPEEEKKTTRGKKS